MKIENKLLLYILLIPIIGMVVGMSGGMYLMNYSSKISQFEGSNFLKQREIELQKKAMKLEVNSVINDIFLLQQKYDNIDTIINKIKELYPNTKNNYIFIYKLLNFKGGDNFAIMLLNPNRPDLEGKLISTNYKIKGFAFREKMLELIKKSGEGYVEYYYKKPYSNKVLLKISYFKYYQPLNLIVANGIYLDTIENIITKFKNHLEESNIDIIKKFIFISILIFLIVLAFTIFIARNMLKEFNKFRKTISLNEKKLKYKLYVDELTKLKSRKALVEDILRKNFNYLILIDIDNFRSINQYFGAKTGDQYLIEFANLLKQFRKKISYSTSLYRIGSDEFVITFKNINFLEIQKLIEKLHTYLNTQNIIIDNEEFDVDSTIVISKTPNPLKKALIALSYAKENKISMLSFEDIKDKIDNKEFFELKKILKTAIEKNQITPFAQPIVNENQEIIKYELLMRIVTEDKIIPPYFLDFAKEIKLYSQLSEQMIDKCFDFINKTDVLCSINIDIYDIKNKSTHQKLKNYVKNLNKPIIFEILESESFENYQELKNFIEEFKEYNVLFAIDDFGSGYSNYSEILELKPDYLKLDGSIIKNINNSKENIILLQSILFLTNMMNIKTTAEFVENEAIFKKLRAIGIDEFQGYYFDKPKPINEIL